MVVLTTVKLGTLTLKTVCKPIAKMLKNQANNHPKFPQFIINIAQENHKFMTRVQRRIYGRTTDVAIRPLDEEKAVHVAADLLGELFMFTVAGAAVIFEVQRSSRAEVRKEELRRQEIQARNEELDGELELLKQKLSDVEQLARARGLAGILGFGHAPASKDYIYIIGFCICEAGCRVEIKRPPKI